MSLKNTKSADKIIPIPTLKISKHIIGYISIINFQENLIPSINTKIKKTNNVSPKFIKEDTFLESKNIYLGTFILENIPELEIRELIPVLVASR